MKKTNSVKCNLTLSGESSNIDKGALVCDLIMLGVFIWNQIFYEMDMLFLIIPLVLVGIYLVLFCIMTDEYCFTESSLEIRHRYRRTVLITYDSVFNFDASAHDSFINILQSNKVKVYYTESKKKRMILCRPKDVASFVEALKQNCPEFSEEKREKTKLDVFLNKNK